SRRGYRIRSRSQTRACRVGTRTATARGVPESYGRRALARGCEAWSLEPGAGLRTLSVAGKPALEAGLSAFRWGAANARDRARTRRKSLRPADGRAVRRSRTRCNRRADRDDEVANPEQDSFDPAGGAEDRSCATARGPLCGHGSGADHPSGNDLRVG